MVDPSVGLWAGTKADQKAEKWVAQKVEMTVAYSAVCWVVHLAAQMVGP